MTVLYAVLITLALVNLELLVVVLLIPRISRKLLKLAMTPPRPVKIAGAPNTTTEAHGEPPQGVASIVPGGLGNGITSAEQIEKVSAYSKPRSGA